MKSDLDEKFDSLRNAPTELSKERVESIIKGLPNLPATPLETTNWTTWFSLNNLLIVSFVGAVAAGMLLWNKNAGQSDVLVSNEVPTETEAMALANTPTPVDNTVAEKTEATTTEIKTETKTDETLLATNTDSKPVAPKLELKPNRPIEVIEKSASGIQQSALNPPSASTLRALPAAAAELKKEDAPAIKPMPSEKVINPNAAKIQLDVMETDPNAVPDLTNGQMRRLKKSLFENLMNDKLIINGWKGIEIDLPGDEIIVNGKVIDQNLFDKYNKLTKKVGWGPDRKIKFDTEYIKVGDFTATGFRGSGFGTFRTVPKSRSSGDEINHKSLALKKKREIKKEQRELDAFSQTLLDASSGRRGRKNVLDVNLKQDKCRKLHQELYELFLEDGLIESKTDYVLIEISKKSIHINVMELNEVLYEKYSELFESYKIKAGHRRQVRMSAHTIRVGDFTRGSFTGTSLTF